MRFERNEHMEEMLGELEFFEYSYAGGKEYTEAGYLKRHERESAEAYNRRTEESTYTNFCAPIVDLYNAHLFRAEVSRDYGTLGNDELFGRFLEDADFEGNPYNQCVKGIVERGSVYGIFGVIVDKPRTTAQSRADELAGDIRPYLALYEPESILDFTFERTGGGRPRLVELVLAEEDEMIRVWRPDVVEIYKQKNGDDARLVESFPNALGEIPFVLHKNRASFERFESTSDVADIAYINKRIYQLDSNAFEIIESAAFPLMEVPEESLPTGTGGGDGSEEIEIGTGNGVIRSRNDTVGHRYIEPTHTSLTLMLDWRRELIANLHQIARAQHTTAQKTQSTQSGVALEIEFQQLNALLSDKAQQAEATENRILTLAAKWLGKTFDGEIEYPESFGIRDLARDIETAISALSVVSSPTFKAEVGKDIAARMLGDDNPQWNQIEEELTKPPTPPSVPPLTDAIPPSDGGQGAE